MNWFERFGITGTYFLAITLIWIICLTLYKASDVSTQVIGIFAFTFLPLGYILTMFSQYCYYLGLFGGQIHKKIVKEILDKDLKKKLELSDCSSEAECEAKLTSFVRLEHKHSREVRTIASFFTRRFDALALCNSITLYTILSPIISVLLVLIVWPKVFSVSWFYCFILLLSSVILIFALRKSTGILESQMLGICKKIWDKAYI